MANAKAAAVVTTKAARPTSSASTSLCALPAVDEGTPKRNAGPPPCGGADSPAAAESIAASSSLSGSSVKVPKRGAPTFGKFQGSAGVAHDMIFAYKGPVFFGMDDGGQHGQVVLGLVFHNDLPDQPPEVNIGEDPNPPAVCCSVM